MICRCDPGYYVTKVTLNAGDWVDSVQSMVCESPGLPLAPVTKEVKVGTRCATLLPNCCTKALTPNAKHVQVELAVAGLQRPPVSDLHTSKHVRCAWVTLPCSAGAMTVTPHNLALQLAATCA
jgi:hypothetical protein